VYGLEEKGHPRDMTHPLEVEGKIDRCGERSPAAEVVDELVASGGFRPFAFVLNSEPEHRFRWSPNNRFSRVKPVSAAKNEAEKSI